MDKGDKRMVFLHREFSYVAIMHRQILNPLKTYDKMSIKTMMLKSSNRTNFVTNAAFACLSPVNALVCVELVEVVE